MIDREKVIYSIERCICHVPDACRDCGYDNEPCPKCFEHLLRDALSLLKAQEPKPPRIAQTIDRIFYACDNCGKSLFVIDGVNLSTYFPKYCAECGRAVKWDAVD